MNTTLKAKEQSVKFEFKFSQNSQALFLKNFC